MKSLQPFQPLVKSVFLFFRHSHPSRRLSVGFNVETVEYKNISFTVWDVGGQVSNRSIASSESVTCVMSSRIKFVPCGDITFRTLKVDLFAGVVRTDRWTLLFLGLIFVVDSNDRERVGEARDELQRMLAEDELREAVLLIFANKQVRRSSLVQLDRHVCVSLFRIFPMR